MKNTPRITSTHVAMLVAAGVLLLVAPFFLSSRWSLADTLWHQFHVDPPISRRHAEGYQALGALLIAVSYWLHRAAKTGFRMKEAPKVVLSSLAIASLPMVLFGFRFAGARHNLLHLIQIVQNHEARLSNLEMHVNSQGTAAAECLPGHLNRPPKVDVMPVASGFNKPVYVADPDDGTGRLFVVEKPGKIRVVRGGVTIDKAFLDLHDQVLSEETADVGWEAGLLGMAFHPSFRTNGRFYVDYTSLDDGRTVIAEYHAMNGSDVADVSSRNVILEVPQPGSSHNGGQLVFGTDGYLYIGLGDGKSPPPNDNGQDKGSLLGKILRIDVDTETGARYEIPADNPFAGRNDVRPEIFAYGLRNPWRFSFDRCNGSLFAGDVGQASWEEVDLVVAGANYGWPITEGPACFRQSHLAANKWLPCNRRGLTLPIHAYRQMKSDKEGGDAVVGGFVYRGHSIPALTGRYLFADFISKRLWMLSESPHEYPRWKRDLLLILDFNPSSFGEGPDGEIYLVDYFGGALYQLVPGDAELASSE